jgi:hypothetical protein
VPALLRVDNASVQYAIPEFRGSLDRAAALVTQFAVYAQAFTERPPLRPTFVLQDSADLSRASAGSREGNRLDDDRLTGPLYVAAEGQTPECYRGWRPRIPDGILWTPPPTVVDSTIISPVGPGMPASICSYAEPENLQTLLYWHSHLAARVRGRWGRTTHLPPLAKLAHVVTAKVMLDAALDDETTQRDRKWFRLDDGIHAVAWQMADAVAEAALSGEGIGYRGLRPHGILRTVLICMDKYSRHLFLLLRRRFHGGHSTAASAFGSTG